MSPSLNEKERRAPPIRSIQWRGSAIVWTAEALGRFFQLFQPLTWIARILRKRDEWGDAASMVAVEVWVIGVLVALTTLLFACHEKSILTIAAVYSLVDVTAATFRDIAVSPAIYSDAEGPYIGVRNPLRWMLMAPLNAIQVIISFALLYRTLPVGAFAKPIGDSITALYFSTVTFTTLGYGDISPTESTGKLLVTIELLFFLMFLGIKLPIAVSLLRAKQAPALSRDGHDARTGGAD